MFFYISYFYILSGIFLRESSNAVKLGGFAQTVKVMTHFFFFCHFKNLQINLISACGLISGGTSQQKQVFSSWWFYE